MGFYQRDPTLRRATVHRVAFGILPKSEYAALQLDSGSQISPGVLLPLLNVGAFGKIVNSALCGYPTLAWALVESQISPRVLLPFLAWVCSENCIMI